MTKNIEGFGRPGILEHKAIEEGMDEYRIEKEEGREREIRSILNEEPNETPEEKKEAEEKQELVSGPEMSEEEEVSMKRILDYLFRGNIDNIHKIKNKLKISDKVFNEAIKIFFTHCFEADNIVEIKNKLRIPKEVVQELAKKSILHAFSEGRLEEVSKIKKEHDISNETFQEVVKNVIAEHVNRANIYMVSEIKDKFKIPDDFLKSEEFQEVAKEGIKVAFRYGYGIDNVLKIIDVFNISHECLKSEEFQEAAKELIRAEFSLGNINQVFKIKDKFKIPDDFPDDFFAPQELEEAGKKAMKNAILFGNVDQVFKIKDKFKIPDDLTQKVFEDGLITLFRCGRFEVVSKVKNKLNIPDEFFASPKIQSLVENLFLHSLNGQHYEEGFTYVDMFQRFKNKIGFSDDFLTSPKVQEAAKKFAVISVFRGVDDVLKIIDAFHIPHEFLNSEEIQGAVEKAIIMDLSGDLDNVFKTIEDFHANEFLKSQEFQAAVKEVVDHNFSWGHVDFALKIIEVFGSNEFLKSQEFQDCVKQTLKEYLEKGKIDDALKMIKKLNTSDEIVQEAAKEALVRCVVRGYVDRALKINRSLNVPKNLFQKVVVDRLADYLRDEGEKGEFLKIKEEFTLFDAFDFFGEAVKEAKAKLKYEALKNRNSDWSHPQKNKNFEKGAEVFGYRRMLAFVKPNHTHDALYAFNRVLELQEISGLNDNMFYHNILQQVAMDTGTHGEDEDTSYQKLNKITQGFNKDIEGTLNKAKEYKDLPMLIELLKKMNSPSKVFGSWKMLIQYKDLTHYLENEELLHELEEEENPNLKNYVNTLLFHPSVEDSRAVELFYTNPYEYFGLEASYTSQDVHNSKKPTNYVEIPHLDLSSTELRDALVNGVLDKIQVWKPLEVTYTVASKAEVRKEQQEFFKKSFLEVLKEFLGKESALTKKAKSKLFGKISHIIKTQLEEEKASEPLKRAKEMLKEMVKGFGKELSQLSEDSKEEIRREVYKIKQGSVTNLSTTKYTIKTTLKSDPNAIVGSECMQFGDGKNTSYTFNPICGMLIVQRGGRPTAQSVLTLNKNIFTQIADIEEYLESGQTNIADILPQEILMKEKSYITCDSVEVPRNYRNEEYDQLLRSLYRDFFKEYLAKFGEAQNLNTKEVISGSCDYELPGLEDRENTYLALSPVSYSDTYEVEEVGALLLEGSDDIFYTEKFVEELPCEGIQETPIHNKQIEYLTFKDSLETSYIEGKVYKDTTLKQGAAEMENALIAKDINNAAKERPNLSLKHVTEDGKMQAYLVAYEGEYDYDLHNENYVEKGSDKESCIYVMDIAKLYEAKKGVGMELFTEFFRLYQENYIKKDKLIPIVAEAREVSSYKLITRYLNGLGKSVGIEFVLEEGDSYQEGNDTMHPVTIKPIKNL
ncbi:MAG: hypothetical protein CL685_01625 [Candidatus Magasanikbacteria bacterium]|nr:hypothetical protein [Candidatus Magasanikbacteria bacterium]|tara:strand:- start:535 stop:4734 length:4200 start_codon:yes stop_codon:yes gene_type:complete